MFCLAPFTLILAQTKDRIGVRLKPVGQWPESGQASPRNVVIVGSTAYVAGGSDDLQIIDISNSSAPRKIGAYNTPGNAVALAVAKNFVYLIAGTNSLQVIDVSDLTQPRKVGECPVRPSAQAVAVKGNIACVAEALDGLVVYDVSDPTQPKRIGREELVYSASVVMADNYAYVAGGMTGFYVVDLSNPAMPVETARYTHCDRAQGAQDLVLAGRLAYVADTRHGVFVLDVTDPKSVACVGVFAETNMATRIALDQNLAFVIDTNRNLLVFEISQGTNAVLKGTHANEARVFDICSDKQQIFMAMEGQSDLMIMDLTRPESPRAIHSGGLLGRTLNVAFAGQTVLLANGIGGVQAIVVDQSGALRALGSLPSDQNTVVVAASANLGIIGEKQGLLRAFDATRPDGLTVLSEYRSLGEISLLTANQSRALVVHDRLNLDLIDYASPSAPKKLASYIGRAELNCAVIMGESILVAEKNSGLTVLNFAEAGRLARAAKIVMEADAAAIASRGDYVLIACDSEKTETTSSAGRDNSDPNVAKITLPNADLVIIGLQDPSQPKVVSSFVINRIEDARFDAPGRPGNFRVHGVAVEGNVAYLLYDVINNRGKRVSIVRLLDITNLANPVQMSKYVLDNLALRIAASNHRVYLPMGTERLLVLNGEQVKVPDNFTGTVYDYMNVMERNDMLRSRGIR